MKKYSVWIIDDAVSTRTLMKDMIDDIEEFGCTDEFENCEDVLSKLQTGVNPDIFVLDMSFPTGMDGLDALKYFKKAASDTKIVAITGKSLTEYVSSAIKRGADAFLVKPVDEKEVKLAFYSVLSGNIFLCREAINKLQDRLPDSRAAKQKYNFTPLDLELLKNLGKGLNIEKIGKNMSLAPNTIHNYLNNLFTKLDVHSQREAVSKIFLEGLVEIE